jgi:hypothetical protein
MTLLAGQPVSRVYAENLSPPIPADVGLLGNMAEQPLVKEYRYLEGQEQPRIDEGITEGDITYRLVSTEGPVFDAGYQRPTMFYSRQITKDIPLDGIDNLGLYFPSSVWIDEGGFQGSIGMAVEPYRIQNVYESWSGQVDRQHTIEGLPDNDVVRLPQTMDFTVSSDESMGAVQTKTLTLLDVRYEVMGTNPLGLPDTYRAYLTYRGSEDWLQLHHYVVAAYYAGDVAALASQYLVTATYEPVVADVSVAAPVTPRADSRSIADDEVPQSAATMSVSPALVASIVIGALVLLVLLWWLLVFYRNARLVREDVGHRKVVARRRVNVVAGEAVFRIPEEADLCDGAAYSLELSPRLAGKQGVITVIWRDQTIAREELRPTIALNALGLTNRDVMSAVAGAVLQLVEEEGL